MTCKRLPTTSLDAGGDGVEPASSCSFKTVRPHTPCDARYMERCVTTWSAGCGAAPHSRPGAEPLLRLNKSLLTSNTNLKSTCVTLQGFYTILFCFLKFHSVGTFDMCLSFLHQDTLRENCNSSHLCSKNCCVNKFVSPVYFVTFVTMAQFVLVNVVVAVLMKVNFRVGSGSLMRINFCKKRFTLSQFVYFTSIFIP